MIDPVAPQKPMQPPAPLLEKRQDRLHIGARLHPISSIVAPPRLRPAPIALLTAPRQRHYIRPPPRPTPSPQRNIKRKPHLMKCHVLLLPPPPKRPLSPAAPPAAASH